MAASRCGATRRICLTAYRAALEERTRERVPLEWAATQHGLANALAALARRKRSPAQMEKALKHMRAAVEGYRQAGDAYWGPIARRQLASLEAELFALKKAAKPG
jgi:hypothetical protein